MWICHDSICTKFETFIQQNFLFHFCKFFCCFSFLLIFYSISLNGTLFLKILHSTCNWFHRHVNFKTSHMCAFRLLFVKLKVMECIACTKIITNWRGCSCYFVCQDENFQFWNLLFSSIRKVNHMKSVFLYYGFQHWHDAFYHFHLAIFAVESCSFRFVFKLNFASLQISKTVDICQKKTLLNFLSLWICQRFCVERSLTERKIFGLLLLSTRIWIHQNNDFKKAICVHVDYYLLIWKWWKTSLVQN